MTATSIASRSSAPSTGGRWPKDAEPGELHGKAGGKPERSEEGAGILDRAGGRHGLSIAASSGHGHDQNQMPVALL
jgi:hypothetical protein